jgi:hypothetical protein
MSSAWLGISIKADDAGISIPASVIPVQIRNITVPEWIPLLLYQSSSGIGIFVHFST